MATLQQLGTVRLRLRLGGEDYQETLHAVQGDTGRVLEFDVLDGSGTVVTDLTGVTPVLFVRRPNGKEVGSATGEIVGGVIRITIPSSLLAYAGETKAQIQLTDSANQHKLHDHPYRLHIEESLEAGASPGENLWFSLAELTEAIEEVHLLVEQYDTDVAAVATMRDDVTTKHAELSTTLEKELERQAAEETRVTTQTQRDATWAVWQDLIEDGVLLPATPAIAGAVKIDKEGADTAVSVDTLNTELAKKVDVVAGMGLSQHSYTTIQRQKLDGIEIGANKYVHPNTHSLDVITETATKKIMTSEERTKLSGIAANANDYTHPSTHPASMITQDSARRMVSDTQIAAWDGKVESYGTNSVMQIAVISAGGSTTGIPNNSLILELE